jgi:novobiocin biosynthesis protein NovU/D-mycarose 3-C-methyltransferase
MLGVEELLAPDGTFVVEVHYLVDLLNTLQFDTVYHEHLCYYSLHALAHLFGRFGFAITAVERLPMHGGAIRVLARRTPSATGLSPGIEQLLELEQDLGICSPATYELFGAAAIGHRNAIKNFVSLRKQSGRTISAYGAAGRATTLLNFCALSSGTIDYVVDESPSRVGRFIPGVQIPIVPRSHFAAQPTDDCLLTAWNYRREIIGKENSFLENGGAFLTPFPTIEVIRETAVCRKSA